MSATRQRAFGLEDAETTRKFKGLELNRNRRNGRLMRTGAVCSGYDPHGQNQMGPSACAARMLESSQK